MQSLLSFLDEFVFHISYCLSHPMQVSECGSFWSWTMVAGFAMAVAPLFMVIRNRVAHHFGILAELERRKQADGVPAGEAAQEPRWVADPVPAVEPAGEDLEDYVRSALSQLPVVEPVPEQLLGKAA
jgi:hypothetical protein